MRYTISNPPRETAEGTAGEFSSPELTFCVDSYFCVRSTPVLPQWHVKDPGHSAKNTGSRLQLNTYTSLTHRSRTGLTILSRRSVGTYQGNELIRNWPDNACPQLSQFTEPLWSGPVL